MAKYQDIYASLRNRILSGEFGNDGRLPPERALAEAYRASYATVTRALADLKRAGLIRREWGRGTFVAGMPNADLETEQPHPDSEPIQQPAAEVAITVDDAYALTHPFIAELLQGIGDQLTQMQQPLQLFGLSQQTALSQHGGSSFEMMLRERRLKGVITCSPHRPELVEQILGYGVSVVSVGSEYPGLPVGCVMSDIDSVAEKFTARLAKLKHHRIGLLMGPSPYSARLVRSSTLLSRSLVRLLRAHDMVCPKFAQLHTDDWYQWASVEQAAIDMLQHHRRPTAVVCMDMQLARSLVACADQLGLRVPEDLTVLVFCGQQQDVAWTGVRLDVHEMGRIAVKMASEQIAGKPPQHRLAPIKSIVGNTHSHGPLKRQNSKRKQPQTS